MAFTQVAPFLELASQSVTPGSGKQLIYPKTNGIWYVKNSAGTETAISSSSTVGADVTLTPGADARNVVQPTGDFIALVVKNNASQAKAPFQTQSSAGSILSSIDKDGNIYSAGVMGLAGTAIDATIGINLVKDFGNIAAGTEGMVVTATTTLTGNNANVIAGAIFKARVDQATFNHTAAAGVRGFTVRGDAIGASGTATGVVGLLTSILNSGAGTITNGYGAQITSALNSGGGTITNVVGLAINTQTVGSTSNTLLLLNTLTPAAGNWGIYSTSANNNSILGNLGIGLAAAVTPTNPISLSGQAARTMWMERHTTSNTAGNSLTLQSGGATSGATDKKAGALILATGVGTGSSVPGIIQLQAAAISAASATTDNANVDRLITGASKVLTDNSAITIVNVTLASNSVAGGIIRYCVECTNGTDYQVETGFAVYSCTNKGGAFSNTITEVSSQQNVTGGSTLTTVWAISAANPAAISINADSSLTPSTGFPRITYSIENLTQQAIAIA